MVVKTLSSEDVHPPDLLTRGVNLSSASLRVPPSPASDSAPPSAPRSPRASPGGGGPSPSAGPGGAATAASSRRTDVQPRSRREPRGRAPAPLPAAVPVSHALRTKLFCCQVGALRPDPELHRGWRWGLAGRAGAESWRTAVLE